MYRSLTRRNRVVGLLRLLVPGAGIVIFVVLVGFVVLANIGEQFSIGRVTLETDRMVVETPSYTGVTGDGTSYRITALSAETALTSTDTVSLDGATLVMTAVNGVETTARAARAEIGTTAQTVTIPGDATLSTTSGIAGTLSGTSVDFKGGAMKADGGVDMHFARGEHLVAKTMSYDSNADVWRFTGVTLTLPSAPGALAK